MRWAHCDAVASKPRTLSRPPKGAWGRRETAADLPEAAPACDPGAGAEVSAISSGTCRSDSTWVDIARMAYAGIFPHFLTILDISSSTSRITGISERAYSLRGLCERDSDGNVAWATSMLYLRRAAEVAAAAALRFL